MWNDVFLSYVTACLALLYIIRNGFSLRFNMFRLTYGIHVAPREVASSDTMGEQRNEKKSRLRLWNMTVQRT